MKDKICTVCGITIANAHGNAKYCPTCHEVVKAEIAHKFAEVRKKPLQIINCAVCGKEVSKTSSTKYCADCRKEANKAKRKAYLRSTYGICKVEKQPKAPPVAKPKAVNKPLNGEYRGQAFYPLVAVKQPKTAFTYNDIKQLADKNGVSWQKQAKVLGV